jgi:hypothetical protein
MRRKSVAGTLAVAALSLAAGAVAAQEQSPFSFHGFIGQGYLKSQDNRLHSAPTEQGTFAFSEEAINVTWQPSPRLRIGAQVFARDVGSEGNHRATFDWALGDYRWRDWLGVRAGKVKLPAGLYSTVVDADAARPEILQPDGAYSSSSRDITVSLNGVQVYGVVALASAGDLEYEAWVGGAELDDAPALRRLVSDGAASILPTLRLAQGSYTVGEIKAPVKKLYGGALEFRPPLPGLRLRVGMNAGDLDVSSATLFTGFAGPAPVSFNVRNDSHIEQELLLISSVEYQRGPLRASAEYYRQDFNIRSTLSGLPVAAPVVTTQENRPGGWYAQLAYRFTPRLQGSAYYSAVYADRDDPEGELLGARGLPAHRGYQKALVGTVRLDVTPNWLVKAEMHDIDGTRSISFVEQPRGLAGLRKDWWLFVAKTTFHF